MARGKPDGGGYVSGDGLQTRPRGLKQNLALNYRMDEGLMKTGCLIVVAGRGSPPSPCRLCIPFLL
jgi:hypothetical protein